MENGSHLFERVSKDTRRNCWGYQHRPVLRCKCFTFTAVCPARLHCAHLMPLSCFSREQRCGSVMEPTSAAIHGTWLWRWGHRDPPLIPLYTMRRFRVHSSRRARDQSRSASLALRQNPTLYLLCRAYRTVASPSIGFERPSQHRTAAAVVSGSVALAFTPPRV